MCNRQWIGTLRTITALAVTLVLPACDMRYTPEESVEVVETSEPAAPVTTEPVTPAPAAAPVEPYIAAAGRSPIPAEGETFDAPIPAVELTPPPEIAPPVASAEPPPQGAILPWTDAGQYIGHQITAEGVVMETANIGNICFLNFQEGDREKFYVVVYEDVYPDVPGGAPETYYLNKRIRVTGEVTTHRNRTQVRVSNISQIEVVDETGQ
jgi:hypothetical protein